MEAEISFGSWVRRQRQALDLTHEQLTQCVGYSLSTMRKIESDERRPSQQLAELLAEYLQVPSEQHPTFLQVAHGHLRLERRLPLNPSRRRVSSQVTAFLNRRSASLPHPHP